MGMTVDELIAEHIRLDDALKEATKRFNEYVSPYKMKLEEVDNQLLALSNEQKWESTRAPAGTAYRSTLLSSSVSDEGAPYVNASGEQVTGRLALIDFSIENWQSWGSDLLMVQAQKDAVKRYLEEKSAAPPGVKTSFFTRINVRRT